MPSNRLQLNADKTAVLRCASDQSQHQLFADILRIDDVPVTTVSFARNLSILTRTALVMRLNLEDLLRSVKCVRFTALCRQSPSQHGGHAGPVLSRLGFGNNMLVGLLLHCLQLIQNAVA